MSTVIAIGCADVARVSVQETSGTRKADLIRTACKPRVNHPGRSPSIEIVNRRGRTLGAPSPGCR